MTEKLSNFVRYPVGFAIGFSLNARNRFAGFVTFSTHNYKYKTNERIGYGYGETAFASYIDFKKNVVPDPSFPIITAEVDIFKTITGGPGND